MIKRIKYICKIILNVFLPYYEQPVLKNHTRVEEITKVHSLQPSGSLFDGMPDEFNYFRIKIRVYQEIVYVNTSAVHDLKVGSLVLVKYQHHKNHSVQTINVLHIGAKHPGYAW